MVGVVVALSLAVQGTRSAIGFGAVLSAARSEVKVARQEVLAALESAAFESERANAASAAAEFERRAAGKLAVEVNRLGSENRRLKSVFQSVASLAPDTCAAVVTAAADALVSEQKISTGWREAHNRIAQSYDSLRAAFQLAQRAYERTVPATEGLVRASERLERASRKSFLQRITPRLHIGATAGVDPFGRPNVVAGVGMGWSL